MCILFTGSEGSVAVRILKLALLALLIVSIAPISEAALPKQGNIVVIVHGQVDSATINYVENIIINRLLGNGYKVVDRELQARIRREQAARLALDGNVEAIMKLGSRFGYSTLLSVQIAVRHRSDNYGFHGATASIIAKANATSNGSIIYAETVSSKEEKGFSNDEVVQLAVESVSLLAANRMVD